MTGLAAATAGTYAEQRRANRLHAGHLARQAVADIAQVKITRFSGPGEMLRIDVHNGSQRAIRNVYVWADARGVMGHYPAGVPVDTFGGGSAAKQWAVVSDLGGIAEINATCPANGTALCTYPWYTFNGTAKAFSYGGDYPGTQFDYRKSAQFATTPLCGGPFGPDTTYCDTVLSPVP